MKPLTARQVERWSDVRLNREVAAIYARMAFYRVSNWTKLPDRERADAYLVRNEVIRRTAQLSLYGSESR